MDEHISILAQTEALRNNREPMWVRLRELLVERGLDPSSLALVEIFPDDSEFEYGVVTTADGHVYQFGYDYLHVGKGRGTFSEWRECSNEIPHPCSTEGIAFGIKLAGGGTNAF